MATLRELRQDLESGKTLCVIPGYDVKMTALHLSKSMLKRMTANNNHDLLAGEQKVAAKLFYAIASDPSLQKTIKPAWLDEYARLKADGEHERAEILYRDMVCEGITSGYHALVEASTRPWGPI